MLWGWECRDALHSLLASWNWPYAVCEELHFGAQNILTIAQKVLFDHGAPSSLPWPVPVLSSPNMSLSHLTLTFAVTPGVCTKVAHTQSVYLQSVGYSRSLSSFSYSD